MSIYLFISRLYPRYNELLLQNWVTNIYNRHTCLIKPIS